MYFLRRIGRKIGLPGIVLSVSLMVVAALAAFIYRGYVDNRDIIDSRDLVLQSRAESRNLRSQLADQIEKFKALEAKLGSVQAALETITPSQNTYYFGPNQSMILADGRLTVGLIGSPTNERVSVNINGKQHSAAAGDVPTRGDKAVRAQSIRGRMAIDGLYVPQNASWLPDRYGTRAVPSAGCEMAGTVQTVLASVLYAKPTHPLKARSRPGL